MLGYGADPEDVEGCRFVTVKLPLYP